MSRELPLSGWRVLVTRPAEQAGPLLDALRAAGAVPLAYPTITLAPPPDWTPFDSAFRHLESYSWIVFTSPSAARFSLGRLDDLDLGARLRSPGAPAVAAVGNETARTLRDHGVHVAVVPSDQRQEGLVTALANLASGARVLFPQAIGGRELLREQLVAAGAVVDVVAVSRTVALPLDDVAPPFDVATFASPSALNAFLSRWTSDALRGKVVAVMGPTTGEAARAAGVAVQVMPPAPSVADLVAALVVYRPTQTKDVR